MEEPQRAVWLAQQIPSYLVLLLLVRTTLLAASPPMHSPSSLHTHLKSGIPLAVLTPAPLITTTRLKRPSLKPAAISPTEVNVSLWTAVEKVFSRRSFHGAPLREDFTIHRRGSKGRMKRSISARLRCGDFPHVGLNPLSSVTVNRILLQLCCRSLPCASPLLLMRKCCIYRVSMRWIKSSRGKCNTQTDFVL